MSVIFVAGSYGVGKSTVCQLISSQHGLPSYSASQLISAYNGEDYKINKSVNNKEINQDILIHAVNQKLKRYPQFLLAGHFCIFRKDGSVDCLPERVYPGLAISCVLLLTADSKCIYSNLNKRGNCLYTQEQVANLIMIETQEAERITKKYNFELCKYHMKYDGFDASRCWSMIEHYFIGLKYD